MAPPWPNNARAALAITMDNMGEAADLHRRLWPGDQPVGSHPSVTVALPAMLALLKRYGIKATYFVEGWNFAVYPEAIRAVAEKGHEVGFHAWQHEVWKSLDGETEVGNLDRSLEGVRGVLGRGFCGFRPPGGLVTERSLALMRERGFTYLSPAAARCAVVEGVAMVPFRWEDIDAYFYLPSMAAVRERNGDGVDALTPSVLKERLCRRVDELCERGGYSAFLFHPFLMLGAPREERMQVMEQVLEHVKGKGDMLWVARCAEVAEWVRDHEEEFGGDPGWDLVEWKKK